MFAKRKKYQSYINKNRFEIISEFYDSSLPKDRMYMVDMMKPIIISLDQYGITEYQDFCEILHISGLKATEMNELISEFIRFINSNDQYNKINWIKKRELRKSNNGIKNIIFNRLAVEYPNELFYFFNTYISNKLKGRPDSNRLIQQARLGIGKLANKKQINEFLSYFI